MRGNNFKTENGRQTKYVQNFGKSIQCKFCEFEWFFGEQALNIHEELCARNQILKRQLKEIKKK